jgi:hypothetical protein
MEIIKGKTTIKLSEEDREVLEKAKNIFSGLYNEMTPYDALLGYSEEEIGDVYYCLETITDAEDRELVFEEV